MKKNNPSPYGTYGLEKVDAPKKNKRSEPVASKITGKGDLRVGGKK